MMRMALLLCGVGQLALAAGSLAIPVVLKWREDTSKLQPLTREVFWTYAGYIWVTNVCFGVLSTWGVDLLLDGSVLARVVAGYIAAYWGARLVIQFTIFDRSMVQGWFFRLGEAALVSLFTVLTAVYGTLLVHGAP